MAAEAVQTARICVNLKLRQGEIKLNGNLSAEKGFKNGLFLPACRFLSGLIVFLAGGIYRANDHRSRAVII